MLTLSSDASAALDTQLVERKPQLLVLWSGTHEAGLPELDPETLRTEYVALISRLRASTGAECVLMGPTDRLMQDANGRWTESVAPQPIDARVGVLDPAKERDRVAQPVKDLGALLEVGGHPRCLPPWRLRS